MDTLGTDILAENVFSRVQGSVSNVSSTGTAYTSTLDTSSLIDDAIYSVSFSAIVSNNNSSGSELIGFQLHLVNNTTILFGKAATRQSAGTWASDTRQVPGSSLKNSVRLRLLKESWSPQVNLSEAFIEIHRVG